MQNNSIADYTNKIEGNIFNTTGGLVDASQINTTENVEVNVVATHLSGLDSSLNFQIQEAFPLTATQDQSIILLGDAIGLYQAPATTSTGMITVQGTLGSVIPTTSQFISTVNNVVYNTSSAANITMATFTPSSVIRVSNIVQVTTTTAHNLATGNVVNISGATPNDINGINLVVTVTSLTQFTYAAQGIDVVATGTISLTFNAAYITLVSATAGANTNLPAGSPIGLTQPISGVDNTGYVQFGGLTGGTDQETIQALQQEIILANQLPTLDVFQIDFLALLLIQNTGVTRAWVYQARNSAEAGTVTTVSVNDNQVPITLSGTQLMNQFNYITSIYPSYLDAADITCLTANLVPISITITVLTPNTVSMTQAIKQELINFFQTNSVIKRVLDPNTITTATITVAVLNTIDPTTNLSPTFATLVLGSYTLANDNDLAVLGVLTINGNII